MKEWNKPTLSDLSVESTEAGNPPHYHCVQCGQTTWTQEELEKCDWDVTCLKCGGKAFGSGCNAEHSTY